MAVTADRVVVELEARLDRYEANVAQAESRFDKAMSGIQKSAGATERFVSRAMSGITGALAGVSAIALARSFLTIADEAKKLEAQLRLATAGFGSFGQAQKDVQRIADVTRSGLSETASLYGNFVRGAKELGATQAEAARATETFSKTLKISGADTNQAASATLQFGQALAAGALRGDELNSILEASPRLARLLAESMGQPIGQIKKLGEEGALTSDKLLKALTDTKFTAGIDAEFNQMPVTFDDAMTRVYNAALTTFSAFDQGGEFSQMLADFVGDGADGFADLAESAEEMGIAVRSTLAGLGDAFQPLLDGGLAVFEQLGGKAFDLQQFIRATLRDADALLNIGPGIANRFGANGRYDSNLLGRYDARQRQEQQRLQGQANERRFRSMIGGYDAMGNPLPGTPGSGGSRRAPAASSSGGKKGRTPRSPLDPDAFAREEASLNDRILRLKSDESLTAEERAKIELDRVEAARNAANQDVSTDKKYTDAQKTKIVALNDQVAALEAASVVYERDAEIAKRTYTLETEANKGAQNLLQAQGELAETRRQQYEVEKRILALRQSQERADYELLLKSRDPEDVTRGKAGLARLDERQPLERAALDRRFESPLEAYTRRAGRDPGDQIEELITQELDYVQDSISGAITKRLGVKDPFLSGIIDMFIQQVIMKPLADAFAKSGSGSPLGSIFSFLGSTVSGARANGGPVSAGGTYLVGERGPELLKMGGSPGVVVPNHALRGASGGATVVQHITIDASNSVNPEGFERRILAISGQQAAQAATQMGKHVVKNMPNRMGQFSRDGT